MAKYSEEIDSLLLSCEKDYIDRTLSLFGQEITSKIKTPIFYEKKDLSDGFFQTDLFLNLNRLTNKSYSELVSLYQDVIDKWNNILSEKYDKKRK